MSVRMMRRGHFAPMGSVSTQWEDTIATVTLATCRLKTELNAKVSVLMILFNHSGADISSLFRRR